MCVCVGASYAAHVRELRATTKSLRAALSNISSRAASNEMKAADSSTEVAALRRRVAELDGLLRRVRDCEATARRERDDSTRAVATHRSVTVCVSVNGCGVDDALPQGGAGVRVITTGPRAVRLPAVDHAPPRAATPARAPPAAAVCGDEADRVMRDEVVHMWRVCVGVWVRFIGLSPL